MTWRMDAPVRVGDHIFTALTATDITARHFGTTLAATAEKRPVVILMLTAGDVSALDLEGQVLTPAQTASTYPDAVAQFRARAGTLA